MLYAKLLESYSQANQKIALLAQDLIQCWNLMDEDSRHRLVAELNTKYGMNCNVFDLEVEIMVLQHKADGVLKSSSNAS